MCLDLLKFKDKIPFEYKFYNAGYKVVRIDPFDGKMRNLHYDVDSLNMQYSININEIKFKKKYKASTSTIAMPQADNFYESGFHIYKNIADAERILTSFRKIIKVKYWKVVAIGKQDCKDSGETVVAKKIKFIKIVK